MVYIVCNDIRISLKEARNDHRVNQNSNIGWGEQSARTATKVGKLRRSKTFNNDGWIGSGGVADVQEVPQ